LPETAEFRRDALEVVDSIDGVGFEGAGLANEDMDPRMLADELRLSLLGPEAEGMRVLGEGRLEGDGEVGICN
jgi:hypothetical protein